MSKNKNRNRKEFMKTLQKICLGLTIIGAINWGMIGIFDFNLVEGLFGAATIVTRIVYTLVGIAGLINVGLLVTPFDHLDDEKRG